MQKRAIAAVELALPDSGTKLAVTTPRGSIETRMFSVGIRFTEALDENERECSTVMQVAAVCDLPGGCLGVFGRDFLSRAKLAYDGMAGEASLAFPTADGHFIEMPLRPLKT